MEYRFIEMTRDEIGQFYAEAWGGLVVTPERSYRAEEVNGVALRLAVGELGAVATWVPEPGGGQVVTLDALIHGRGYGRILLAEVERRIAAAGGKSARLFTTNDNLVAMRLYMLAGYRLVRLYPDSMDAVRALKPSIPRHGQFGIPLQDMWEFSRSLPANDWAPEPG